MNVVTRRLFVAGTLTPLLVCTVAFAQSDEREQVRPYSRHYTGSFLAMGVMGGANLGSAEDHSGETEGAMGLWLQGTSPLQVIDVQTGYLRRQGASDSEFGHFRVQTHTAFAGLGLHPFFTLHLENNRWAYTASSFHIFAAARYTWARFEFDDGTNDRLSDLGYQLGAAIDTPIDDVDDGLSFWLGASYTYDPIQLNTPTRRDLDIAQQTVLVRLSVRHNGLLVPIPAYR